MSTMLTLRQMIPSFRLPSNRGVPLGTRDYRHERNLILLVLHDLECDECRALLAGIAARYAEFAALDAEVLVIVGNPPDDVAGAPYPFPVLSDADGAVRRQLLEEQISGEEPVGAFATDRFGKLFLQTVASGAGELPAADELLEWAEYADMQGPECGVPEWPEG
jgi:hypothetical protein